VCLSAHRKFTKTLIKDNWGVRPGAIRGNLKISTLFTSVLMKLSCRLHALAFLFVGKSQYPSVLWLIIPHRRLRRGMPAGEPRYALDKWLNVPCVPPRAALDTVRILEHKTRSSSYWPTSKHRGRLQLKCDGTRWRTGGEVKGKLANGVGRLPFTLPRNLVYLALLPLMRAPRFPVVDWTDAPADLNGLVHFAERWNLVSARVPSHFKHSLVPYRGPESHYQCSMKFVTV
jgi:hypothetical protein